LLHDWCASHSVDICVYGDKQDASNSEINHDIHYRLVLREEFIFDLAWVPVPVHPLLLRLLGHFRYRGQATLARLLSGETWMVELQALLVGVELDCL
jgi:hypothetical protein